MGYERRHSNPGKRERQAGKRHRRARIGTGAGSEPLKVGRKHPMRAMTAFYRDSRLGCG